MYAKHYDTFKFVVWRDATKRLALNVQEIWNPLKIILLKHILDKVHIHQSDIYSSNVVTYERMFEKMYFYSVLIIIQIILRFF